MTRTLFAAIALGTASLAAVSMSAPAVAQTKDGIAVVDANRAVGTSSAATTAFQQMQVTYKANIDSLNARRTAIQTDLQQKQAALQAAVTAAGQSPTTQQQQQLQQQYAELQQASQAAQSELNQLGQPLQLARAYVLEQISAQVAPALRAVMSKNKIKIVMRAEATDAFVPSTDVTDKLVAELNQLVPSVGIVPPQGWQPGQQQQPAAAAAPAASSEGR